MTTGQPDSSRSNLRFGLAVAAVLALLPAGWALFLRTGEPPPPRASIQADAAVAATPRAEADAGPEAVPTTVKELSIEEVTGSVQVRKGQGEFVPAAVGQILEEADAVRTLDGRARLSAEGAFEVQVEPGSSLEIGELTERLSKLRLDFGLLVAKVRGGGGRLEVSARGSDAVAASSGGTFAVSNNGAGTVAAGAREGEVEFKAAGRAVLLRAGQQSIAGPGTPPTEPAPVPASLFLKVDWPQGGEVNSRRLVVAGKTNPGAVLLVGGVPAPVDKEGRFSAAVRLREGKNAVLAECLDVGGNRAVGHAEVVVDTQAPEADIATQKLWER